jgi:hypothetical protein
MLSVIMLNVALKSIIRSVITPIACTLILIILNAIHAERLSHNFK